MSLLSIACNAIKRLQEIADKPDINEEVTPEQQEAYNLLVVKGSLRDRASPQAPVMRGKVGLFFPILLKSLFCKVTIQSLIER